MRFIARLSHHIPAAAGFWERWRLLLPCLRRIASALVEAGGKLVPSSAEAAKAKPMAAMAAKVSLVNFIGGLVV